MIIYHFLHILYSSKHVIDYLHSLGLFKSTLQDVAPTEKIGIPSPKKWMSRKKSLISHNFARSSQQKVYKQPLTQQIETNWFFLPRMTDNNDNASITEKSIKIFIRIFPFERFCESCAKIDMNRKVNFDIFLVQVHFFSFSLHFLYWKRIILFFVLFRRFSYGIYKKCNRIE